MSSIYTNLRASRTRFVERLNHFVCVACKKWWTIGDAPVAKKEWFCPWCGKRYAAELKKKLSLSKKASNVKLGIYEHYRGKRYEVLGVAFHSEILEELIVYRAQYGDRKLWVRPLTLFFEKVGVDGGRVPRFKFRGK